MKHPLPPEVEAARIAAPPGTRIQRQRTKGWKMPPGAIYVGRPSRFANPFTPEGCREAGYQGTDLEIRQRCVESYRIWLGPQWREVWDGEQSSRCRQRLLLHLPVLRGRDLACWCPLDQPCHADVLLELANL